MEGWSPELAALLGVVEGLTEFLPVSSTGHLILVGHFLGFTGDIATSGEISIQLGSILAIFAYERAKIVSLFREAAQEQVLFRNLLRENWSRGQWPVRERWSAILYRSAAVHRSLWFLIGLAVAFAPAALLGFVAHTWIEAFLFTPHTVAVALIAGGLIILLVEGMPRRVHLARLDLVGTRNAFWVGIAQCVSLIPGISRSGATIIGGLLAGMDRKVATEYSFFLALPTMIAATTYKMIKSRSLFSTEDALALGLGLVVAFLVAWAVIALFLAYVKRYSLNVFAYYRIALGAAVLMVFR